MAAETPTIAPKLDIPSLRKQVISHRKLAPRQYGVGELAKALEIIAGGGDVDYVGATGVELIGPGEAAGTYREISYEGGKDNTAGHR